MRKTIPKFTKEKAIFLAAALLCAGVTYRFIASQPVVLQSEAPRDGSSTNPLAAPENRTGTAEESAYFHGTRKTPFAVPREKPPVVKRKDDAQLPVPPPQLTDEVRAKAAQPEFSGVHPEELYSFSGVIVWKGQSHALLAGKKTTSTLRAREGDLIAGGFRITRIEKQSIELKHESGYVFVLKDKGA